MVLNEPRIRAVVLPLHSWWRSDCSYLDRYVRANPSYCVALLPPHRAIVKAVTRSVIPEEHTIAEGASSDEHTGEMTCSIASTRRSPTARLIDLHGVPLHPVESILPSKGGHCCFEPGYTTFGFCNITIVMLWPRHCKYDQAAGRLHQTIILSAVGSMAHCYTATSTELAVWCHARWRHLCDSLPSHLRRYIPAPTGHWALLKNSMVENQRFNVAKRWVCVRPANQTPFWGAGLARCFREFANSHSFC
jgi:hypothetical protein